MPGLKSGAGAAADLPARAPAFLAGDVRRRVEAQSRDNGKSVTVPRINLIHLAGPRWPNRRNSEELIGELSNPAPPSASETVPEQS